MELSKSVENVKLKLFRIFFGKENLNNVEPRKAIFRLLLIVLAVIFGCMLLSYPFELHLGWGFQEMRPVTWISFFQLLLVGFISQHIFLVRKNESSSAKLWHLLSIFFIFLAFDELLRFHESIDHRICDLFGFDRYGPADHIDDVIILLYGVFGAFLLIKYFSEVMIFKKVTKVFIFAAIFAVFMVIFDLLGGRQGEMHLYFKGEDLTFILRLFDIIEESCKSLSEVCFVGAFLNVYYLCFNKKI